MKFTYHDLTINLFNWDGGRYTLVLKFRGNKKELLEKLDKEIKEELERA